MLEIIIFNGPLKPDLQWIISYPDRKLTADFQSEHAPISAYIERMDEQGDDGFTFHLVGRVASGEFEGQPFRASYDVGQRKGHATIG